MKHGTILGCLVVLARLALAANRPNVLLICVDDLKPLLGCYGDPLAVTPHIDRLAARGVRFERAYINQAVCAPSRNALMLGLRPESIGIYDLPTNFRHAAPDAITMAQHFRQHGYRTEALGKVMHNGHGNSEDAASWSVPHWRPGGLVYALPANQKAMRQARDKARAAGLSPERIMRETRGPPTESADVPDNVYGDGLLAEEAVRRLRAASQKPEEPWFIAVGFSKPHLPFNAPTRHWDLHDPAAFVLPTRRELPEGAPDFAGHNSGELRRYSGIPETGPLDDDLARHLIHGYYAATSFVDAQIGRVLDALDETGLADRTIVALWSDHGWHLGDHGLWCKHTNFEQATRIPLILAKPGVMPPGERSMALVETVDLYPTLAELAGLPPPPGALDGRSFAATARNPALPAREAAFHVYPRQSLIGRAVRTARYRLVEWKQPGADPAKATLELYDYEADPLESRNLAADKPEVVARLQALIAAHPEAKPQIRVKAAARQK